MINDSNAAAKKLLVINSSSNGENSVTIRLNKYLTNAIQKKYSKIQITERDLATNPLPHLSSKAIQGFYTPVEQMNNEIKTALKQSDEAVEQLLTSDIVIIGAPMWNLSIPSSLKAWIDHIVRPGKAFKHEANGVVGLIKNKKVIVTLASGGVYSSGPMQSADHDKTYMKTILNFIGIEPIFVSVEGVGLPQKDANILLAEKQIDEIVLKI